ncbi:LysR family transcriptional regulator [Turicimonas muris]|uniref:LysR family transcriptional regulator n=2 Tax=Turicimonas muris TaxID=1796652 RepID=UPI00272C89D2|nr:LysR family transcriptional regulator [Turicimonas muris]
MKKEDSLLAWRVFVNALETGNLTQTSIMLDIDPAAASRHLDSLEAALGVQLLYRNRRPFIATAEGDDLYEDARKLLALQEQMLHRIGKAARRKTRATQAVITVSAAQGYGHGWLMPRLLEYMKCYPDITFDTLTERNLKDLADGKIEVLFAVHRFNRQGFVIKPYATLPCLAFASPSYIQQYGMLEDPQDSALHVGLTRSGNNFPISKDLVTNGTDFKALSWGKEIKAENSILLKKLAVQGVGIVFDLPVGFFIDELENGLLVPVLNNWRRTPFMASVVTTEKLYKSDERIKTFVDWMTLYEGKASNQRTLKALSLMDKNLRDVFTDEEDFYQPEQAFFKPKRLKKGAA